VVLQRHRMRTLPKFSKAWLTLLLLAGSGCRNESRSQLEPAASASVAPAAQIGVDAALVAELRTIGRGCQKAPGEDRFKCPNAQNWKLIGDFMSGRRDRAAAVGALATTLVDAEPGVRGLTLSVLHSAFGGAWGRDAAPGVVAPQAARALLEGVFGEFASASRQAIPAAVNAAMLTGQDKLLDAQLAKPQHAALRSAAYPYLMTMGRLRAFSMVQKLVKESEANDAAAAAEAPLNMDAWSDAEQKEICGWSDGLLSDARPEIAQKAVLLLAHCSGERLDKLLARAGALAASNQLDGAAQGPLIAMCGGAQRPHTLAATSEQCERARRLLVRVAESPQADAAARAYAVTWVAQIWPDQASARFLKRLERDANAEVARQARDSSKRLAEAAAQLEAALSSSTAPAP
jgi:hypothetical protein